MANVAIGILDPEAEPTPVPAPWSLAHRILFRFLFSYLLLYSLPNVLFRIPGVDILANRYMAIWRTLCPWVARRFFHLTDWRTTYFFTGAGDTTLGYIQVLVYFTVAITAALIWTAIDRKRGDYRRLETWLRLLVRYSLAIAMLSYGFAKVFPTQFRTPGLLRLIEPYGDFSPMGVLWWFMGASTPYIIFSGAAEATGGLLLLFRRTTTLGALVSFGAMLNVVALNYCYDVPVKLYSTHLLLMAVYLASGDLRRLVNVLLLNRATEPADWSQPRFEQRWLRVAATLVWIGFAALILYRTVDGARSAYSARLHPVRPPIYGLYEVESFARDGQEAPPLTTDSLRWRKLVIEGPGYITLKMMDDSLANYKAAYDLTRHTVTLSPVAYCETPSSAPLTQEARGCPADETKKFVLTYSRADAEHLALEGSFAGSRLAVRLRSVDASKFLLLSRGFHWINEFSLNW